MRRTAPAERAGFALSLLLLALAWPDRERPPEACLRPVLRAPGEVVCRHERAATPDFEGPLQRLFAEPIDPNRADAVTLETLPGIGPARAAAIVRERCRRPFASIADLARVPGLGPQRIRALEPFLGLGERLALEGPALVKSATCRSSCENGGGSARAGAGCPPAQTAEARK